MTTLAAPVTARQLALLELDEAYFPYEAQPALSKENTQRSLGAKYAGQLALVAFVGGRDYEQMRHDENNLVNAHAAVCKELYTYKTNDSRESSPSKLLSKIGDIVLANVVHGSFKKNYDSLLSYEIAVTTTELEKQQEIRALKLDLQTMYYQAQQSPWPIRRFRKHQAKQSMAKMFLSQQSDIRDLIEQTESW